MRKPLNLLGKKFGKWTVVSKINTTASASFWYCKCDCGKFKQVRGTCLNMGLSKSCGCGSIEASKIRNSLPFGQSAFNTLYGRYKKEAKQRSICFNLSKTQFKKYTQSSCYYCGSSPLAKVSGRNGDYVYNGIDRVNNKYGYNIKNVVTCCKKCNLAKYKQTKEEFLLHIRKIYEFQYK